MFQNWTESLLHLKKSWAPFGRANPKVLEAYRNLNASLGSNGALDAKTRALIAMAVAVTTRCDGCLASHASNARKAGVTEAELSDALGTAIALNAGAAYVYSMHAMEAFGQMPAE